jgi:ankyrin repeat protein
MSTKSQTECGAKNSTESSMAIVQQDEQQALEQTILQLLKNLMQPNANRLKTGITILMTSDSGSDNSYFNKANFEKLVSKDVQQELADFLDLMQNPNRYAPLSSATDAGKYAVLEHIKTFTLKNLKVLDERLSILPNAYSVTKTIREGERLKSVIHTSALRNVVTAAHFQAKLNEQLTKAGFSGVTLKKVVDNASESMVKLHTAVANNDLQTVIQELKVPGIDVNLPNPDGLPLLQLAVREGHAEIVEALLKQPGIDVNRVSINGWTALHFAARLGFADIVKMLLAAPGIDVNIANSDGWTALNWAAWHGYLDVVDLLLTDKQIDINKRDSSQGTPLHWAARNGQADVISVLLAEPTIEINAQDVDKKTPLHYAVAFDHAPATSALLAVGNRLDVNLEDIDGLTPLHWAARNGSLELVGLLLEVPGIKLNLKDHNEMIAADWAKHNEYPELVPLLLPKKMKLPSYFQIYWEKLKHSFIQAWSRG